MQQFIDDRDKQRLISPEVSRFVHTKIKEAAGIEDLYAVEKQHYNELMMGFEDEIRDRINLSAQPFETALRYALAGNIIDLGPPQSFVVVKTLTYYLHVCREEWFELLNIKRSWKHGWIKFYRLYWRNILFN